MKALKGKRSYKMRLESFIHRKTGAKFSTIRKAWRLWNEIAYFAIAFAFYAIIWLFDREFGLDQFYGGLAVLLFMHRVLLNDRI